MKAKNNSSEYSPFQPRFEPQKLNAEADYIDVSPKEPTQELPILYSPGWGIHSSVLRPIVASFVEEGRRTIAIGAPHGIGAQTKRDLPMPESRKVESILEVLRQRGVDKVDAVAHSESGLALTAAALEHPEKFRTIVLVNAGGLIEHDSPLKVATRTVMDTVKDLGMKAKALFIGGYQAGDAQKTGNLLRMVAMQQPVTNANPLRSMKEIEYIGKGDIRERLKQLQEKGVRVIVVQTTGDEAFPPERTAITQEHYNERVLLPGKHNEIISDPSLFAQKTVELLKKRNEA